MTTINTNYFGTNRGVIKILQIVIGFILSSLVYGNWYGGYRFYHDGRLSFVSSLNTVVIIINIVVLILHVLDVEIFKFERIYSIIATILFLLASILIIWISIEVNMHGSTIIASCLIVTLFLLFLWDVKIIQGEAPN
ncbi:hypothetical protein DdX_16661 [Ditylenchus destructor]|uniref:MARVEL domain-containing protein n=1 Tax=Ditylenchus destructor TaxID=166010 RepID=A0AAD4QZW2_9BILA|nr:hypothetical protein DdX_16661 [Ditylenchus destructor]